MTDELKTLVEAARTREMSAEEREEQLRNFAAGNAGIENPLVTRAVIDDAAKRLAQNSR